MSTAVPTPPVEGAINPQDEEFYASYVLFLSDLPLCLANSRLQRWR
jgi:hypothetical protein